MSSDWTTPGYLANISAEELGIALRLHGVRALNVGTDEDGVSVAFVSLRDAETLLTLATDGTGGPGSLYDRVSSSCVTLSAMADSGEPTQDQVGAALDGGWVWMVHPDMSGRRVGWHVTATMPSDDANQLTATLNELKRGFPV